MRPRAAERRLLEHARFGRPALRRGGAGIVVLAMVLDFRGAVADETVTAPAEAIEPLPFGPFPLRSVHPLTMPLYSPIAERARPIGRSRWALSLVSQYGSVQKGEGQFPNLTVFDGEFHRLGLLFRYGITEALELSLELPIYARGSGFLDDSIQRFHKITGLVRDNRPRGEHEERVLYRNQELIDSRSSGYRLADIPVQLKYGLLDEARHPLTVSLRGAVELPTGSESDWIGNGEIDGGIGLLAERTLGDFSLFLNLDYRFLGGAERFRDRDIELRHVPALAAAVEYRPWKPVAFMVQLSATDDIIDGELGFETTDDPQVQLHVGVHFEVADWLRGHAGLSEDLVHSSSPDVVLFFGLDFAAGFSTIERS